MFMFDFLPNDITLKVLRCLDFYTDVKSLLLAIGIKDDFTKDLYHVCNKSCFKHCRYKPINCLTPIRFVKTASNFDNVDDALQSLREPLNCDFLIMRFKYIDPLSRKCALFNKLMIPLDGKRRTVVKNHSGTLFLKNTHLESSSSLQLKNCNRLELHDCTVGKSDQKFYFKSLEVLQVSGFTNTFFDLLNLDEYPQKVLKLSTFSEKLVPPKPIALRNWNNHTLNEVKLEGLETLEKVNLPSVRALSLSFVCNKKKPNGSKTSIINNLNAPNLIQLRIVTERGCPPFISNFCIGRQLNYFVIEYIFESFEFVEYLMSRRSDPNKLLDGHFNLHQAEIFPNILNVHWTVIIGKSYRSKVQKVGNVFKQTSRVNTGPIMRYNLEELKNSNRTQQLTFTTQDSKARSFLKVDSFIDTKIGLIRLIHFQPLRFPF